MKKPHPHRGWVSSSCCCCSRTSADRLRIPLHRQSRGDHLRRAAAAHHAEYPGHAHRHPRHRREKPDRARARRRRPLAVAARPARAAARQAFRPLPDRRRRFRRGLLGARRILRHAGAGKARGSRAEERYRFSEIVRGVEAAARLRQLVRAQHERPRGRARLRFRQERRSRALVPPPVITTGAVRSNAPDRRYRLCRVHR